MYRLSMSSNLEEMSASFSLIFHNECILSSLVVHSEYFGFVLVRLKIKESIYAFSLWLTTTGPTC